MATIDELVAFTSAAKRRGLREALLTIRQTLALQLGVSDAGRLDRMIEEIWKVWNPSLLTVHERRLQSSGLLSSIGIPAEDARRLQKGAVDTDTLASCIVLLNMAAGAAHPRTSFRRLAESASNLIAEICCDIATLSSPTKDEKPDATIARQGRLTASLEASEKAIHLARELVWKVIGFHADDFPSQTSTLRFVADLNRDPFGEIVGHDETGWGIDLPDPAIEEFENRIRIEQVRRAERDDVGEFAKFKVVKRKFVDPGGEANKELSHRRIWDEYKELLYIFNRELSRIQAEESSRTPKARIEKARRNSKKILFNTAIIMQGNGCPKAEVDRLKNLASRQVTARLTVDELARFSRELSEFQFEYHCDQY